MLYLRSLLFNLAFYVITAIIMVVAIPLFFLPRPCLIWAMRQWSWLMLWLLRVLAGIRYELRGFDQVPQGPVLIAAKHQSMWDTIAYTALLNDPAMVLKRELLLIPFYGWYARKARMIAVDRGAHGKAIRGMIAQAKAALQARRPIVIFPQGTRVAPGAPPNPPADYKAGVAALYRQLGAPCVPVAVNSGLYWPRRQFLRKPGTIVLECLDPIEPGLERRRFMTELESRIETASNRLLAHAGFPGPPPISPRPVDKFAAPAEGNGDKINIA